MARSARTVIPHLPHHVTQRGSRRGLVFFEEADHSLYLNLLKFYCEKHSVQVLSYCLMPNHVHLILVPETKGALSQALKVAHMRYATAINVKQGWTGHLWQERFYSAPLDEEYFWVATRYVEVNPVRAGIVSDAANYRWSSAPAHCSGRDDVVLSPNADWKRVIEKRTDWADWLRGNQDWTKLKLLRERTSRDLPCGSDAFVADLERQLGKPIMPRPRGRPASKQPKFGTDGTVPI